MWGLFYRIKVFSAPVPKVLLVVVLSSNLYSCQLASIGGGYIIIIIIIIIHVYALDYFSSSCAPVAHCLGTDLLVSHNFHHSPHWLETGKGSSPQYHYPANPNLHPAYFFVLPPYFCCYYFLLLMWHHFSSFSGRLLLVRSWCIAKEMISGRLFSQV